eukprot:GEMP01089832.1.p1 GENE.GEMP01089832.1~~GEMP01089832.1.p1  ORF type:complete len:209 (+),score=60.15 GEMP01089832.1:179-805(+)
MYTGPFFVRRMTETKQMRGADLREPLAAVGKLDRELAHAIRKYLASLQAGRDFFATYESVQFTPSAEKEKWCRRKEESHKQFDFVVADGQAKKERFMQELEDAKMTLAHARSQSDALQSDHAATLQDIADCEKASAAALETQRARFEALNETAATLRARLVQRRTRRAEMEKERYVLRTNLLEQDELNGRYRRALDYCKKIDAMDASR